MISTKILFSRLGTNGAKLFFTVAIEDSIMIRDCVLRDGQKGPYVAYPSKPRLRKVVGAAAPTFTQEIKDEKPIYDSIVDMYFDKAEGQEERKATQASWDLKKQITDQAEQAYAKLSGTQGGRGVAQAASTSKDFAKSTGKSSAASIFGGDDSDELPF